MTKREMFTATINVLATIEGTEELVQGLTHEIEMLDKKAASKSDKPTEKQEESAMFAGEILQILESATEPMTIKGIKAQSANLSQLEGSQRVSSILSQLRKDGKVKRTYVKKVAHFELGVDDICQAE